VTFSSYAAIPATNWSLLKEMAKSPAHYRYRQDEPRPDTPAMAMGRAVHCAVLEPDAFPLDFTVWRGGRRQGKTWESFVDSLPSSATILSEAEYERCLAIRDAVRSHPVAGEYLDSPGEAEKTLLWTDPDTLIACKARLDWLMPGTVVDLKTTKAIDQRRFARTCADFAYHGQAAFYSAGAEAETDQPHGFVFIAVESDAPHDVAVYELDDDSRWAGECLVGSLLAKLKACRESGDWPGAYPAPETLTMPPWCFPDDWDGTAKLEGLR
jgi:hypothetical protein